MLVRKTRPEEARRINEIFSICFEMPYSSCPCDPDNDDCVHWAAYDDDGEMMSSITVPEFTIRFDGTACKMAGIGAVETLPQYRRLGGIRGCFEALLPELYQNGFAFSYLYPFSTAYYRQFGYECCVQKYTWEIDLGQLALPRLGGRFLLAEKNRPLTQAIQTIDQVWEQYFNMMVQHKDDDYQWTTEADPAAKQEFTYVWFNRDHAPKAYTTFRIAPADRSIQCSRFCFADREGFLGLLEIFRSMAADHGKARFPTPALTSLQYLMPEWSLGAARWELQASSGMVRVVNAEKVLKMAKYLGSGQVVLEIQDPQIPENNGRFSVAFQNGRASHVCRTEDAPDAVMAISTFSALISGVSNWAEAKYTFSGLEVLSENPCLEQVFFPKPRMIVDFF